MDSTSADSVAWPPVPGKFDLDAVSVKAKEAVGTVYEDTFVFTSIFLYLREMDHRLRDLNRLRHDIDWLTKRIDTTKPPQRAVLGAALVCLQEEETRHKSVVEQLRVTVATAKARDSRAAREAELAARPTFGTPLLVST